MCVERVCGCVRCEAVWTLTTEGYGVLPYENTSHRSTPKLHTSLFKENRCRGKGRGILTPPTVCIRVLTHTLFESLRGRPLDREFPSLMRYVDLSLSQQAKVRHLGLPIAIQEDVTSSQVSVSDQSDHSNTCTIDRQLNSPVHISLRADVPHSLTHIPEIKGQTNLLITVETLSVDHADIQKSIAEQHEAAWPHTILPETGNIISYQAG